MFSVLDATGTRPCSHQISLGPGIVSRYLKRLYFLSYDADGVSLFALATRKLGAKSVRCTQGLRK